MAQLSGYWTTGGSTGDQQVSYSQVHLSKASMIIAGCGKYQGVAKGYLNEYKGTVTVANTVSIGTGGAVVDGHWHYNDAALSVNIPSAVGAGNTRIDRIVIRCNWANFKAEIYRIAGVDAAVPTPPNITQNAGSVYDITLYQALVSTSGLIVLSDERDFAIQKESILMQLKIFADADAIETGDGKLYWTIPEELASAIFKKADIACTVPGTSGNTTLQVTIAGTDALSTKPAIEPNEYNSYTGVRGLTGSQVVNAGNVLRFDVDSVSTGAKGLEAMLVFEK